MRISDWSSYVCSSDLTRRLYDFCHRNKGVRLHPLSHTHSSATLSRLSRFISLNSAIEVDLSGQVNAESAGGCYLGAVGGQVDYVRAAGASPGGRSMIALPSTAQEIGRASCRESVCQYV